MSTGEKLTIIGIIIGLAIPIVIYLNKRYVVSSFLTIKLDFSNGMASPQGVIVPHLDDDGYGIRDKSIVRHHLTWTYNLTITNNSDQTAFFPRLHYKNDLFQNISLEKLEELEPIGSMKSVIIKIKFFEISDTLPTERKRTDAPPSDFHNLKLLLEYYNGHDSKFYTLYNNADKINKHYKFKPNF